MSTSRDDQWLEKHNLLKEFYQKHGHTQVTSSKWSDELLVLWVLNQRSCCKMESRIKFLNAVGFVWRPSRAKEDQWLKKCNLLKEFYQKHGHAQVTSSKCSDESLIRWVLNQRRCCKIESRTKLLNAVRFVWKKDENKPVNVKNDAEVEQKFIFDLDDVGACEVWNFIEATISSHNKGKATATK